MKKKEKDNYPRPEEKVCFNCAHILRMVGLGQGLKCGISMQTIPSHLHTCNKFQKKSSK
jgi:hypothetical protein